MKIETMKHEFNPFTHTPRCAVSELAESPALDATLSWDGAGNYRIGPSEQYAPVDDGHRSILTRDDLAAYCDGELNDENITHAATWLEENQTEWFGDAAR